MEFEGPVWAVDDDEAECEGCEESENEFESELEEDSDVNELFVDEFFWETLNSFVQGRLNTTAMNRAMMHTGVFVFRLGNLRMTYDTDKVLEFTGGDPDVLTTFSLIDMFARLRAIYYSHDEDVAYGIIDHFLATFGTLITLRQLLPASTI